MPRHLEPGEAIERARVARRMSQAKLAGAMKVNRSTICRAEKHGASVAFAAKLSKFFHGDREQFVRYLGVINKEGGVVRGGRFNRAINKRRPTR